MRILVTGSSGFIGEEVAKALAKKHTVVPFDLVSGQDLLDKDELLKAMRGCDAVVHLAAIPKPVEQKTFSDYFTLNCIGTYNVAQAALEARVKKIVYASSTTYYGIERGIPFVKPVKEANPVMTQHVSAQKMKGRDCDVSYSTSKVIAEQILANYGLTKKLQVIILRLGPTRKKGEEKPFLGFQVGVHNVVQAVEKAVSSKKPLWYEAFTIMDAGRGADIKKAARLLNYKPE